MSQARDRPRVLAPEVVQSSGMDCGPAALKCLLEGFGIGVSYGRLREACQTDLDGTSIDTLEEVAKQLGLDAEQVMVPKDFLLLRSAKLLPALLVVVQPSGAAHFVVVWRSHGRVAQVMDPGTGRRWPSWVRFLRETFLHQMAVPEESWRRWAESPACLGPLRERCGNLKISSQVTEELIAAATRTPGWQGIGALDATLRMAADMVLQRGLPRGRALEPLVLQLVQRATEEAEGERVTVPENYWTVRGTAADSDGVAQVEIKGVVLLKVNGRRRETESPTSEAGEIHLSPELAAAVAEPPARPLRALYSLLRPDGWLAPSVLALAVILGAGAVVLEAFLYRAIIGLEAQLGPPADRLGALAALVVFGFLLLLFDLLIVSGLRRTGRHLEVRLRLAFLTKLPRLTLRYFQSRLPSDMAERSHASHNLRRVPEQGAHLLRVAVQLISVIAGIIWLDPGSAPYACAAAVFALGFSLLVIPAMLERDLRQRTHLGALTQFSLDSFAGLTAIRAHAAENSLRTEQDALLGEWRKADLDCIRLFVTVESVHYMVGFSLAGALLYSHLTRSAQPAAALLLIYWALQIPGLAHEVSFLARVFAVQRNLALRCLEPLGAPEERHEQAATGPTETLEPTSPSGARESPPSSLGSGSARGVMLELEAVNVVAAGHLILQEVSLTLPPGSHVAIVGSSGAGKSSLVGLFLGWHRAASGTVSVDGRPLDEAALAALRAASAWCDPAVHLWNRSLVENLRYGLPPGAPLKLGHVLEVAELDTVLASLPEGLQTVLGEGGALVSGGQGQRVRLGRAMLRSGIRLVILDEAFRGLDRPCRHRLLGRARDVWRDATLLCVTHDVEETKDFPRVLVVEAGRVVEDDSPPNLLARPDSRYATLLAEQQHLWRRFWGSAAWRHLRVEDQRLVEYSGSEPSSC